MATLGMFGGSAPRRMIRLRPEDQDPMLAQMQIASIAAPQVPKPRFTAASMMGENDPAPAAVAEQPAEQGRTVPPMGMFGSSAPKPSKYAASGNYKPGERDWWGEISSDPLGFFLTGTDGLSYKREEAMAYQAAQAAAEERAAKEAALRQQAEAAGLDPGGILAMSLNPTEFGKSYGTNYEAANVSGGDSRVFGNGRATFTAPKFGVDGGYGYTQTPEGIEWGDQRGQSYGEITDDAVAAETGRHNRVSEGIDAERLRLDQIKAALASTGPMDPERIRLEREYAKSFDAVRNNFSDIQGQYDRIRAMGNLASRDPSSRSAADLALIVSFTKMLDPGSVAREGEVKLTQSAASLVDMVRNLPNTWINGQTTLPDSTRQALLNAANEMMPSYQSAYDRLSSDIASTADEYGFARNRVMMGYRPPAPSASQSQGTALGGSATSGVGRAAQAAASRAPAAAVSPGTIDTDDDTGERYRFKGGDPTDQRNWELVR